MTITESTGTAQARLFQEVLQGLLQRPRRLPAKLFYDARGSELFERICECPEYYVTRTEMAILRHHASEIGRLAGAGCLLVEFGSGASLKTRIVLDHLIQPEAYLPIDVSCTALEEAVDSLKTDYPRLRIVPLCADFTGTFTLPREQARASRVLAFFPGSTLGNFDPPDALAFLRNTAALSGRDGLLLVGVDLIKEARILEEAYNDAEGFTAAFNLNLLRRLKEEFGASVDLSGFRHHAWFNAAAGRIEMHLVSVQPQEIGLGGKTFRFAEGESIHTENSYKYTPTGFEKLALAAGFTVEADWTDPERLFAVYLLRSRVAGTEGQRDFRAA